MIHQLKCVWCGKEFEASRKDKLYCSTKCQRAKSWKRQKDKDYSHEKKVCPKCKQEFFIKKSGYNRRYCYDCVPTITTNGAEARKLIKKGLLNIKVENARNVVIINVLWRLIFTIQTPMKKILILVIEI